MVSHMRDMYSCNETREGPIAIAVDRDKTNCHALKWAVEEYIPRGGTIKLVHVVQRSSAAMNAIGPSTDDASTRSERQNSVKRNNQFLPMRCLCMRRNIESEVVLLEDQDVAKALIEYISQNCISTFVLGASLKKSLTRLFKVEDIPSNVIRWAPDFCTVLVVSKGRLSSVRPATRPLPHALPSPSSRTTPLSSRSNAEAPSEMSLSREDDIFSEEFPSLDSDTTVNASDKSSTSGSGLSFYEKLKAPYILEIPRLSGLDDEKSKFSVSLNSPCDGKNSTLASPVSPPIDDADAEKKRMEKVLKETIFMYHAACKEALIAKEKAAELEIWKKKAEERLEMVEETAKIAIMEMEKTELEVLRRIEAERKAVRETGSDDRKMVLDGLGESHIATWYESFSHILVGLIFFYFYFTLR